jgi:thiol-disulfide isomerase/thioredoxin
MTMKDFAKLVTYTRDELGTIDLYDTYRPNLDAIRRIKAALPDAHVEVVGASWCGDCKRQIPRFAAVAERLNTWTIELLGDDKATRERLGIKAIPTFILRSSAGGKELGRIIETPSSDSLEEDLLAIAEANPRQILA